MEIEVDSKVVGYRTIGGLAMPMSDVLTRVELPGKRPYWVMARGVCNGITLCSEQYTTLKAAKAALRGVA